MSITECFQMRKRRSVDKTPGRNDQVHQSPVGRARCTPCHPPRNISNTPFSDQSLDIVWDNNSPSPARTLSLGKRKKHYGSDSSSSGGEISDLVQKLADKSGQTPDPNPPLLALWMSRETNIAPQKLTDNGTVSGINTMKQRCKELQTPSRRPRRILRKCSKSKLKLLKQDIELLCNQLEERDGECVKNKSGELSSKSAEQEQDVFTDIKQKETTEHDCNKFSASLDEHLFDGWDTDDTVLSQVEIPCFGSNHSETQIMTNTQLLLTTNDPLQKNNHLKLSLSTGKDVNENDSIVTESWDFVDELGNCDDEDILESALDEFEKSQQLNVPVVRRVPLLHVKSDSFNADVRTNGCNSSLLNLKLSQNSCDVRGLQDASSTLQRNLDVKYKHPVATKTNFSFLPCSARQSCINAGLETATRAAKVSDTESLLASNTVVKRKDGDGTQGCFNKQQKCIGQTITKGGSKQFKYSKEDIEQKKIEALNRRRQKMAQSQQKNSNTRI